MRRKIPATLVSILAMGILSAYDFCPVAQEPLLGPIGNPERLQALTPTTMIREVQVVIPTWIAAVLATLSLTTLISLFTTYSLHKSRSVVLDTANPFAPREWANALKGISGHVDKLTSSIERRLHDIVTRSSTDSETLSNMAETFTSLRAVLDEKDTEIRRLKKGYDAEVFRKFLYRFIRVDQAISDLITTGDASTQNLRQVQRLLEDAFDECGVERFQPTVGEDYRTAVGIADHPKTERTKRSEDAFKIAEVLQVGYRIRNGENYEIIKPAQVKIFLFAE
jgi:molecular chaperone GrpE (heat shock protein)